MQDNRLSVVINTGNLREKLNSVYQAIKSGNHRSGTPRHFYDLWDLKELAMLEGHDTVTIPRGWLEEIEKDSSFVSFDDNARACLHCVAKVGS